MIRAAISLPQMIIGLAGIGALTYLTSSGAASSEATLPLIGLILGGALGQVNGYRQGYKVGNNS